MAPDQSPEHLKKVSDVEAVRKRLIKDHHVQTHEAERTMKTFDRANEKEVQGKFDTEKFD